MLAVIEHLEHVSYSYEVEAFRLDADGKRDAARIARLGALRFGEAADALRELYHMPKEKETA